MTPWHHVTPDLIAAIRAQYRLQTEAARDPAVIEWATRRSVAK